MVSKSCLQNKIDKSEDFRMAYKETFLLQYWCNMDTVSTLHQ